MKFVCVGGGVSIRIYGIKVAYTHWFDVILTLHDAQIFI